MMKMRFKDYRIEYRDSMFEREKELKESENDVDCPKCHGDGRLWRQEDDRSAKCKECNGSGKVPSDVNESDLNELSKKKLGQYVNRASKNATTLAIQGVAKGNHGRKDAGDRDLNKADSRQKGIERAVKKITQEGNSGDELDEAKNTVHTSSDGRHTATVSARKNEYGEHVTKYYTDGKHLTKADGYEEDKSEADASATANLDMMSKGSSKKKTDKG